MDVYVDSDVVISSLLSRTGTAYYLLNDSTITPIISSVSREEIEKVILRKGIEQEQFRELIQKRLKVVTIKQSISSLKVKYSSYVLDINDAHIVAGAKAAKVDFLLTYNLKHYKTTKLKDNFNIQVLTPALFLQYLRSLEN